MNKSSRQHCIDSVELIEFNYSLPFITHVARSMMETCKSCMFPKKSPNSVLLFLFLLQDAMSPSDLAGVWVHFKTNYYYYEP